ncbi:MAG: hypothetical protein KKD44_27150 [Proteobacteria bacterium]|nr:hypothetical protein [Pseudomonadota bacterium]
MRGQEEVELKLEQARRAWCASEASELIQKGVILALDWVLGKSVLQEEAREDYPLLLCEDYTEQKRRKE